MSQDALLAVDERDAALHDGRVHEARVVDPEAALDLVLELVALLGILLARELFEGGRRDRIALDGDDDGLARAVVCGLVSRQNELLRALSWLALLFKLRGERRSCSGREVGVRMLGDGERAHR